MRYSKSKGRIWSCIDEGRVVLWKYLKPISLAKDSQASISSLFPIFFPDFSKTFVQSFRLIDFFRLLVISIISQLHSRISSTCLLLQKVNGRGRDANVKLISENVRKTEKFVARIRRIYLANTRRPSNSGIP